MEKLALSPLTHAYVEALRGLIRTGVSAAPQLAASPLLQLPVVLQRSGEGATPAKRAHVFIKTLEHLALTRLEAKEAEIARILFGLDGYAGLPIQERYRAAALVYNPNWTWESFRKEPLTRTLLAVYLALEREAELPVPEAMFADRPRLARSGLVGQDWVMESFDGSFNLPVEPGKPLTSVQTRRLRAISQGVNVWRHYAYVRERGVSATPTLSLFGPGKLRVLDTHVEPTTGLRIYVTEVTFPRVIAVGETVEFTIHKQAPTLPHKAHGSAPWDWFGLVTLGSPMDFARISVQLSRHEQPKAIWRYEDIISGLIRPGQPTPETALAADENGYVSQDWRDLSAGYSYGIALNW